MTIINKITKELVAIKILDLDTENDEDIADVQKEISILSKFDTNYVTKYRGSYLIDIKLWIVMDYAALGSMRNISAVPVTCPIIDSSILDLYAQNRIPSPSSFSHFTFTPSTSMETTPTHSPLQSPSLSSSSVTSFDIYNNLSTPIIYTTTSNFSPSLLSVTATMKTGSSPLQSRVTTLNNIDDISSTSSVSNINFLSPTVTRSATCVKKRFNIKINKSSVLNKNKSFSDKDNIPYYSFKSIVESNDLNPTYSKIHL
ncbi:hypothetical protein U3516DRAFT_668159 [Neocallimastix sp. 'constans']